MLLKILTNITVTLKGDTKLNDSSKKVTINDLKWHFQVPKRMVHIHKIKILPFQLLVKRKIKHLQHRRRRLKLGFKIQYRDNFEF